MILHCVIEGEPVGKGRGRAVRQGPGVRIVTPQKTRAWEARAAGELADAYDGEMVTAPVRVEVLAVKARPKRLCRRKDPTGLLWRPHKPDADNVAKAVLDAIEKSQVIANDIQVVELLVRGVYAERDGEPRVEIAVHLVGELPGLEPTDDGLDDDCDDEPAELSEDAAELYAATADQPTRTPEDRARFREMLAEYQRITGTGQPLVEWFDEGFGTPEAELAAVLEGDDEPPPVDAPGQLALLGAAR